jgi:hypothetical protein
MSVVDDVAPIVKDIYPLYLKVYERSNLKFEKLTERYFCGLGRLMPDKARFFCLAPRENDRRLHVVPHRGRRALCRIHRPGISGRARLHPYFYSFRDVVSWAIANGFEWYRSTALNYHPKFHLKHSLDPLDLYVRHT